MNAVTFSVPLVSPGINAFKNWHWGKYKRYKTLWMEETRAALGVRNMAVLRAWSDLKHRCKVEIMIQHNKSFDPDNLWSAGGKVQLDSLVTLGCLAGDSAKHIDLDVREFVGRVKPSTRFTITDLEL